LAKGSQRLTFWEIDAQGGKHQLLIGQPGNGGLIWSFSNAQASNEFVRIREATEFFVGSETEFQSAEQNRPKWWLDP